MALVATAFTVDGSTPEPEFTKRVNLRAGDKVEVRVNGTVEYTIEVASGAEFDAVVCVSGNAREV